MIIRGPCKFSCHAPSVSVYGTLTMENDSFVLIVFTMVLLLSAVVVAIALCGASGELHQIRWCGEAGVGPAGQATLLRPLLILAATLHHIQYLPLKTQHNMAEPSNTL